MGQKNCTFSKADFMKKVDIIKDAYEIMIFYGSFLTEPKMPMTLPEYKQYSDVTEEYFSSLRRNEMSDLGNVTTYYQFYKVLDNLQKDYERTDATENERRQKISDVYQTSHAILKLLIEELWNTCDGRPIVPVKATAGK